MFKTTSVEQLESLLITPWSMSFRNTPSDIFSGLVDIDDEKSKVFPLEVLGQDASQTTSGSLDM
jgi:hypothetical protein